MWPAMEQKNYFKRNCKVWQFWHYWQLSRCLKIIFFFFSKVVIIYSETIPFKTFYTHIRLLVSGKELRCSIIRIWKIMCMKECIKLNEWIIIGMNLLKTNNPMRFQYKYASANKQTSLRFQKVIFKDLVSFKYNFVATHVYSEKNSI